VVCWPLGVLLARLESTVDVPTLRWVADHRNDRWVEINQWLTLMGERAPLKLVCLIAAAVLAVLWRRLWWIPVAALAVQFGLEQYSQEILALVVHRGHPPTGIGTYPSGGCARVIMTFGTIILLVTLRWTVATRWRIVGITSVAVAAGIEGYTRIYLLKHWLTDVVGGWVFGSLLLLALGLSLGALTTGRDFSPSDEAPIND
jgi:membrane-associated phospholipid phosphatase